jgi:N-methylhydantoinase B/oxoprolinase/acetone carboxylase alpha subunit
MAASKATVQQILDVFKKYVPTPARRHELALDLLANVGGNASVMATLQALVEKTFEEDRLARAGAELAKIARRL